MPHGVWFVAYEWSKRALENATDSRDASDTRASQKTTAIPLAAGAFAAAAAWGVGYPFDVIKTRVQASALVSVSPNGLMEKTTVPGVVQTARLMIAECDGSVVRGLYRGFGLKLLRAVPASAVAFFAYEESRRWLG